MRSLHSHRYQSVWYPRVDRVIAGSLKRPSNAYSKEQQDEATRRLEFVQFS
jgi:hypothetical protein